MTTDDLIAALTDWLTTRYPGDPGLSLVIRLVSGREVPLPLPATVVPVRRAETPAAVRREPDDPPVVGAVFRALESTGERMTASQIIEALSSRAGEHGFSEKHIRDNVLPDLHAQGRLRNYRRDPGDGAGAGYGLPEWEVSPRIPRDIPGNPQG